MDLITCSCWCAFIQLSQRFLWLKLRTLGNIFSHWHFKIFFFLFPENRIWQFMQIVSNGDNLHEMSIPVFRGNKTNMTNLSSAELVQRVIRKMDTICKFSAIFMPHHNKWWGYYVILSKILRVRQRFHYSRPLHNSDTIWDIFVKLYTHVKHYETKYRIQEP